MNPTALLVSAIVLLVAVFILGFLLFYSRAQYAATVAELDIAQAKVINRDNEIAHLRTMQARKIDRALFMLAKVRGERLAPSGGLGLSINLESALADAMARQQGDACLGLREIVSEHLVRRIGETATATEGQRS